MADRGCLTPEITILIRTATHETNKHTSDHARRVDGGSAWPCERTLLAEHNLTAP
jgi:hypothetical protein